MLTVMDELPSWCLLSVCFYTGRFRKHKMGVWMSSDRGRGALAPDNFLCVLVEGYHTTLVPCLKWELFFQSSHSDIKNASRCRSIWDHAALQTSPLCHVSIIVSHDWLPVAPFRSKVRSCLCPHDEGRVVVVVGEHVCSCVCLCLCLSL